MVHPRVSPFVIEGLEFGDPRLEKWLTNELGEPIDLTSEELRDSSCWAIDPADGAFLIRMSTGLVMFAKRGDIIVKNQPFGEIAVVRIIVPSA